MEIKNIITTVCLLSFSLCVVHGETLLYKQPNPDGVMQNVLKEYGIESTIVRPYHSMKEESDRKDGGFLIILPGSPGAQVVLDRDYWAIAMSKKDSVSFILNPNDEQSALNIFIGTDLDEPRSDAELKKDPGFTEIIRGLGTIANKKVTWRRWSDENHLYSDCVVILCADDNGEKREHKVELKITANTIERRDLLEKHLASIQLQFADEK